MVFTHEFYIGIQQVGAHNLLTNKAILEMFSDLGNLHAVGAGHSTLHVEQSHFAWMALNWRLEVLDRPKVCSTVTARTWVHSASRLKAGRDYDLVDDTGKVIARATSLFAAINLENGSPQRITPELMAAYHPDGEPLNWPDYSFPRRVLPKEYTPERTISIQVLRFMIDANQHVHNTCYLDLAGEVLPEEIAWTHFANLEIHYRRQITPHSTVQVEYTPFEGRHVCTVRPEDGGPEHADIVMW